MGKKEIKQKTKEETDKDITSEKTDEDITSEETDEDKDKDITSEEEDKPDGFKYNLELDDGSLIQVDSISPDSPRKMSDDTGENFINEYTDVEKLFRKNKDRFNPDEEELCKQTVVWEELLKIRKATDYY